MKDEDRWVGGVKGWMDLRLLWMRAESTGDSALCRKPLAFKLLKEVYVGFKVTTMHNVLSPSAGIEYYIFIVEPSWSHRYKDWFDRNFDSIGKELGSNAAIVRGWDEGLTHEMVNFVVHWASNSDMGQVIERMTHSTVSLIISKGDIYRTDEPIIFMPIANPDDGSEAADEFISEIMRLVVSAIKNGSIKKIAKDLGSTEISLRGVKQGMIFTTLRYLNTVLQLQPNIAGIGMNLNAVIEPLLGENRREK